MLALKRTDWLVPAFREINALLAHGVDLETSSSTGMAMKWEAVSPTPLGRFP